jgi:phosphate starvation-inducible protein PhoH
MARRAKEDKNHNRMSNKTSSKLGMKHDERFVHDSNRRQESYIELLDDNNKHIVFAMGPAGTGKTMLTAWPEHSREVQLKK